ncbi:probable cytochrome P450 6a21 isoform X1 [Photinus pyralis]|uniref:probable cytochrome P450 6a21 isoform X1 n=1 Tax=Photinus pyralis TaxID=7054 RepID=UPI0012674EC4|nr:probable cytochrome P450 6a21 isoform X1 [Photinus pyralis]
MLKVNHTQNTLSGERNSGANYSGGNCPTTKIRSSFQRKYNRYRYVGFFNMWSPAILVCDPEIIKEVLIRQFRSFGVWIHVPHNVDRTLSLNPFVLDGEVWKDVRGKLTSQFTGAKMKNVIPNMVHVNGRMMDYIKGQLRESCDEINVGDLSLKFTGESVYHYAYGVDGGSFSDKCPHPLEVAEQICTRNQLGKVKQMIAMMFPSLGNLIKCTFIGGPITSSFKEMILSVVKYRKDNGVTSKNYLDHLSELKSMGVPHFTSEDQLVSHAFTFFLDGTETTAITFSCTLLELAKNPAVQEQVKREMERSLKRHSNEITYDALQELDYTESVIYETLRLYTVIRLMGRVCLEDVTLPSPFFGKDGEHVRISKGTQIFMPMEEMHRDATHYPNPTEFNPDRFQDNTQRSIFMGFGDGPKLCLGKPFAMAAIKMGLIAILSDFTVELSEKMDRPVKSGNCNIFYSPEPDIWLKFVKV